MIASVLQCEYIKHGMTCSLGSGAIWPMLALVFIIWLVGLAVVLDVKSEIRKRR